MKVYIPKVKSKDKIKVSKNVKNTFLVIIFGMEQDRLHTGCGKLISLFEVNILKLRG